MFSSGWWGYGKKTFSSCLFLRCTKSQNWPSWCESNHMASSHLLKCRADPDQFQLAHAVLCLECTGTMNTFTSMFGAECAKEISNTTNKLCSVKGSGIYKPCFLIICLTWYFFLLPHLEKSIPEFILPPFFVWFDWLVFSVCFFFWISYFNEYCVFIRNTSNKMVIILLCGCIN